MHGHRTGNRGDEAVSDHRGRDLALLDDSLGLRVRGTIVAADPVAYTCRYQLRTDLRWASTDLSVDVEGAGWSRRVELHREDDRWTVNTPARPMERQRPRGG